MTNHPFQSAPDQLIGRYLQALRISASLSMFQSAPDQLIGRYIKNHANI